jgi:hypothetical protein
LHPDGKKRCSCLLKATRALSKDTTADWQMVRTQTVETLTPLVATWPLAALRYMLWFGNPYDSHRNKVMALEPDDLVAQVVDQMIARAEPYEPAKAPLQTRPAMEGLLAVVDARAPWLPFLSEEIAAQLDRIDTYAADFIDPGDGLPTPDSLDRTFDTLDQQLALIRTLAEDNPNRLALNERCTTLFARLAALNDRVTIAYQPGFDTASPTQPKGE